jgi:hypothetical protein
MPGNGLSHSINDNSPYETNIYTSFLYILMYIMNFIVIYLIEIFDPNC